MRALVLVSHKIPLSCLPIQGALLDVARFTCEWYLDQRHAAANALHGTHHHNSGGLDAVAAALAAASSSASSSAINSGDDSSHGGPATVAATVGNALVVRRAANDGSVQSSHLLNR